ncbi:hypothetical protein Acy02nite_06690 [Actinoplanes cyaneus]|uniref:CobE/GbiG C-terminal domain-containing protein n=1 Tax=Actinoplanes cyaneus TaxID=52696 RepID=A0A919IG20_9ACTN|nr:cobalt-precorrin 5A hydrolase [Actinoplanes cyaneus]GID62788.1 hypothetical protein Acy02nite_06690 [Actinoplanes cyaneus]
MIAVGVGARPGTGPALLAGAVEAALVAAGVERSRVSVVATLDRRAAEPGMRVLAGSFGWRLAAFSATELAGAAAGHDLAAVSGRVAAAVGTPSVAEAAALLAAGAQASLLLPKRIVDGVTVAIAGPAGS